MMNPPCSVFAIQSPWHHTPGKRSKYAPRYFEPSGSFQKRTGIDGNGDLHTSSPAPSANDRPFSSKTSTSIANPATWISPRQTGAFGLPPTKQLTISVPPEID